MLMTTELKVIKTQMQTFRSETIFFASENPLKMIKNTFYFPLKALSVQDI